MCHEWAYGAMHKNMALVREIFSTAMDSYWQSRTAGAPAGSSAEYLDLSKARSSPLVGRGRETYKVSAAR